MTNSTNPSNLELYSVYVNTITATEQRRQQSSTVYLTMISAGIAVLGTTSKIDPTYIVVPVATISLIWFMSIVNFRDLATSKFTVIKELEKGWPIEPFAMEWKHYKKTSKVRVGFSYLEMAVPAGFFAASAGYLGYRVLSLICKVQESVLPASG